MRSWQVQEAKARFSELLEASLKEGPQVVTKRGVETAVLVPIEQWRRLERAARPTLKELLLGEGPRFENLVPPRRRWKRRPPTVFE
jgi:prevent-host-death family protein